MCQLTTSKCSDPWRKRIARRSRVRVRCQRRHSAGEGAGELNMYTRAYKNAVSLPPLFWVSAFLLVPYALLFCYSFWAVSEGQIVRHWNIQNYVALLHTHVYLSVLLR